MEFELKEHHKKVLDEDFCLGYNDISFIKEEDNYKMDILIEIPILFEEPIQENIIIQKDWTLFKKMVYEYFKYIE